MPRREPDAGTMRLSAWNLDNNRNDRLVQSQVRRLMADQGVDVLAYQEGQEYAAEIAHIPGTRLHTTRGEGPSERDAGFVVRNGVLVTKYGLVRTREQWQRDKGPGLHWPRSFPWIDARHGDVAARFVSVHMPRQHHALAYATCWAALVMLGLRTRGPLVLIGDWNKSPHRKGAFTPRTLAKAVGGRIVGDGIDFAIVRGLDAPTGRKRVAHGTSDHKPITLDLTPKEKP